MVSADMSAERYRAIQEEIYEIAVKCGRDPSAVALLPVTKFQPWENILPVYQAGCREFAESRLQEALPKIAGAPDDVVWHLVGSLQKNKVRKAIGPFTLIHSVDTPELALKIAECAAEGVEGTAAPVRVLLQVNLSGEATKHGLGVEEWERALPAIWELPLLRIEGLMTMGPLGGDEAAVRRCFAGLRRFRDKIRAEMDAPEYFRHLSMGMSDDYPFAIQEGATLLRIGTAIFGELGSRKKTT